MLLLEVDMNLRYFETLKKKIKEYDKKATNPFLEINFKNNLSQNVFEQTYIWVTEK